MADRVTETMERVIEMRGVRNFRDLGGYLGREGGSVKWRRLFRSGHLARLTREDLRIFRDLDIGTVVDFRSQEEREKRPDRLPADCEIRVLELPMLDSANSVLMQDINSRLRANNFADFDGEALMRVTNRQLVEEFTAEYRAFIGAVLESNGRSVLWHCSGGKDRTGFASALVLKLLGVDDETILEDYLLSNRYADRYRGRRFMLRLFRGRTAAQALGTLFEVRASWIEAAFEAIEDGWGDFDRYRRDALGLSDADIEALRHEYLE